MDMVVEEKFVRTFIDKRIQDRIIFELTHNDRKKKNYEIRDYAISRFANADNYLKTQYFYLKDKNINIDEVEKEIKKLCNSSKQCYIMGTVHDTGFFPLRKALEISFDYLGVSIIIVSDTVAFVKTETSFGSPTKYILRKV